MHTQSQLDTSAVRAAFPLDDSTFAVICSGPLHPSSADRSAIRFKSGRQIADVIIDPAAADRLIVNAQPHSLPSVVIETILLRKVAFADGSFANDVETPRFAGAIYNAMQLKVPHFSAEFPYSSTLLNLHASVACCGGCNGGIHARGLSVLNNHHGSGFSGIWIHSNRSLIDPYPRWQRIICAGGIVEERGGSMTLVDHGWMAARRDNEQPHHAPPPLPLQTIDLPAGVTRSLETKALDGSYVAFSEISIEASRSIDGGLGQRSGTSAPAVEVEFTDNSMGRSIAWLYQSSAQSLRPTQRIRRLAGFIHAEEPGRYILLSDKEEDISL
jgi:hypothetical protein